MTREDKDEERLVRIIPQTAPTLPSPVREYATGEGKDLASVRGYAG